MRNELSIGLSLPGESAARYCGECGVVIDKAKRIHKNTPICGSCYARVFVNVRCYRCGISTRAHKNDPRPVCHPCVIKDRTCLRCGKITPRAGLIFNGKAVCGSCAPHFREKKPCTRCTTLSSRLSRITGITDDLVCEACQRELAYATCSHCGKHRKQYLSLLNRRCICKQCASEPFPLQSCPDCGRTEGRNGTPCLPCAVKRSLQKKQRFLAQSFQHPQTSALLSEFVEWAVQQKKVSKVSRDFSIYAQFFTCIDGAEFRVLDDRNIQNLFTSEKLRRLGLIVQFLADRGYLFSSNQDRQNWSEKERIQNILVRSSQETWHSIIKDYAKWLDSKNGKPLRLRTKRLYLYAATLFMQESSSQSVEQITDVQTQVFLKKHPGQRASIMSFVRFMREVLHVSVHVGQVAKKRAHNNDRDKVQQVASLLAALHQDVPEKTKLVCIAKLLSILYSVPFTEVLKLTTDAIEVTSQGTHIKINGMDLEIDSRIAPAISYYLARIVSPQSRKHHLFPGRAINDSLSADAAAYHLKKISS